MATTINDLKYALGAGLGSRKNKYMIELSYKNLDSKKFNILCKSASFPERVIETATVYHHGRKYNIRSETNYGGTYEVTILDDDKLTLRKYFDSWMQLIDNSKLYSTQVESGSSQSGLSRIVNNIYDTIEQVNDFIEDVQNIDDKLKDAAYDLLGEYTGYNADKAVADYQTEMYVWQLSNTGEKVYGYKLQNVFPTTLGSVQYDDSENDSLVEYNVTFAFSEFEPVAPDDSFLENVYT